MNQKTYDCYVKILKTELVPALGCTEPIALAYASAKAVDVLGDFPDRMEALCSGNIIKNVKGVKVPNSGGLKGVEAAVILARAGGMPPRSWRCWTRRPGKRQGAHGRASERPLLHLPLKEGFPTSIL